MKCGPSPSRALVDDGASTQLRRKNELPIAKRVRSASSSVTKGNENALRPVACTVVAPPGFVSNFSGAENPVGGGGDGADAEGDLVHGFRGRGLEQQIHADRADTERKCDEKKDSPTGHTCFRVKGKGGANMQGRLRAGRSLTGKASVRGAGVGGRVGGCVEGVRRLVLAPCVRAGTYA